MDASICERCGTVVEARMWPFCPHGEMASAHGVVRDEIPGGQVIETLGHEELTFYSQKAIRDEADRRGLRLRDCWSGPGDKYLTNWAAGVTAKTLEDARVLLTRGAKTTDTVRCETTEMTITDWKPSC